MIRQGLYRDDSDYNTRYGGKDEGNGEIEIGLAIKY